MSDLSLFENFIEAIAQVLSRALSDKHTETLLGSFSTFQERLRILSVENLKKLDISSGRQKFCKHDGGCKGNCFRGLIRSFFITFALKYGLGFIPSLLFGKIFKNPSLIFKLAGRDTSSFALFISLFISSYKGSLCLIRNIRQNNNPINAFIAGSIAGFSILLDRNRTRRIMIALYLSTRTLHFMARYAWRHHIHKLFRVKDEVEVEIGEIESPITPSVERFNSKIIRRQIGKPVMPKVPVSDDLEIYDEDEEEHPSQSEMRTYIRQSLGTFTMAVSSSFILYSYVCEPDTLARSYLSFLITHGGIRALQPTRARQYLDVMGTSIDACCKGLSAKFITNAPSFKASIPAGLPVDLILPFQTFLTQVPHEYVMCAIQHPPTSYCTVGAVHAFMGEFKRAFTLYAPLNLIMSIIFRGKKMLKNPLRSLKIMFLSTLRSVFFLSMYVSMAWSLPCFFRTLRGKDERWMYYLNGIIAGSMVLIEQPARRLELGMYCLPRALESIWNSWHARGYVFNVPYGESLYFSLATGILMTLYQHDPRSVHKGYRTFLYRFLNAN